MYLCDGVVREIINVCTAQHYYCLPAHGGVEEYLSFGQSRHIWTDDLSQ